jgi:serine/threonine-protein kinase RsbW
MTEAVPVDRLSIMAADWFPGTPDQVGQARRFITGVLGDDCPGLDDVLVMASEIATNAVRHTRSGGPGGWFDMTVSVAGDTIRVTVTDCGGASEPRVRHDGPGGAVAVGGRGLSLVDALATRWGFTGDRMSRVIWFELSQKACT